MSIDRADGVDGAALSGLCAACLLRAASEMQEASDRRLDPGSTLGPYQIVSTLGCGGMGRVYLGWDPRLCRTVAIKVLAAPFTADIERTRLLQREARIVAGLNHPRICAVHDLGCEVAQRFDASQVRLVDEPRVVQEHVCGSATILPPCFSASTTGVLVYHVARLFRNQLAWFTRAGRQLDVAIEPGSYFGPMLSADGSRVMLDRHDPRTWQLGIWQYDLKRRVLSRLLDESVPAIGALWSPDGRALAFSADTADRHEIYTVDADGGVPQRLFNAPKLVVLTDWSSDRGRLLFQTRGEATRDDVWVLPLDRRGEAFPYVRSRFSERQARFSPDGRWVAFASDESGRLEVYVQPFPATGTKVKISNDGGHQPAWRRDGRELFYLSGDRRLMAVPLQLTRELSIGAASELFRIPPDAPFESRISYAPAADGQRFLVNVAAPDRVRLPRFETQVVVNWPATLRQP